MGPSSRVDSSIADYGTLLRLGDDFARHVLRLFQLEGKAIAFIEGYANQLKYGDTDVGIEVKFDRRLHDTGNLFIEIDERRTVDKPFVASGIYRDDLSRWYLIGDYSRCYVFKKEALVALHMRRGRPSIISKRKTSHGFLIKPRDIPRVLERVWRSTWGGAAV